MKLLPFGDKLLLEIEEVEEKKETGTIIIAGGDKNPQMKTGIVVAAGEGKHESGVFIPVKTPIGSKVIIGNFSGNEIQLEGKNYLLVKESEIYGILLDE